MSSKVMIEEKTLEKIKINLTAMKELFSSEDIIKSVPTLKRPLLAIERRSLKKRLKEITEILDNGNRY